MTRQEFSNAFTTMLNSYNSQANFGEQAAKTEIVLDEYEKSVLLTQAQDIIVKSYFDRTLNQQAQGFDDTPRRQVDFSSLIKVVEIPRTSETSDVCYDERGLMYKMPRKIVNGHIIDDTTDVLFILNEKLIIYLIKEAKVKYVFIYPPNDDVPTVTAESLQVALDMINEIVKKTNIHNGQPYHSIEEALDDGWEYTVEEMTTTVRERQGEYVIVPINYREYDREMSKPYAQPLKKQAWRLFQNSVTGFDFNSELIPKFDLKPEGLGYEIGDIQFCYRVRYVRRPCPIVLEDLPDGLTIEGVSEATDCELNPILHIDILNKAVELALVTRGGVQPQQQQQQQR